MAKRVSRSLYRFSLTAIAALLFSLLIVSALYFHNTNSLPDRGTFAIVENGAASTCGIAGSTLYCWGYNHYGNLGIGNSDTAYETNIPTMVDITGVLAGKAVSSVDVGYYHSCAIADGQAYCWGTRAGGRLGSGQSLGIETSPVAVNTSGAMGGKTVTGISASDGGSHTCAIADGQAYCWGLNSSGQLGDNKASGNENSSPVTVDTSGVLSGKTITKISTGQNHSCAIADGQAYCWGLNSSGQIGNNSTSNALVPVAVTADGVLSGKTVTDISASVRHSCAIADGQAYCWGDNQYGQLGNNTTDSSSVPVTVNTDGQLSGKILTKVGAGGSHSSCAVADGQAYCWGRNTYGQLGNGSTSTSMAPVAVSTSGVLSSGSTVSTLSVGTTSVCITADGKGYCWGSNSRGQLGGPGGNSSVPILVQSAEPVTGSAFRLYDNQDNIQPEAPLAATNSPGTLVEADQPFRLRIGVAVDSSSSLAVGEGSYQLQVAPKSAATCSAQSTGFSPVTTSSKIAWHANPSVSNSATISSHANDPTPSGSTSYQTYRSEGGMFKNTVAVTGGHSALWDFSLRDNDAPHNESYCLRLGYSDGTALKSYSAYAEIKTAPGELSVSMVDESGNQLTSPSFQLSPVLIKTDCQTANGAFGVANKRLRIVNNMTEDGWSVSLAATNGDSSLWQEADSAATYDYNDPSGYPPGCTSGFDGDGVAGLLSVYPNSAVSTPATSCSNTGISFGSNGYFSQNVVSAITVVTGSSSAGINCSWDITGIELSQLIPGGQPSGIYNIDLTATVVAQ